MNNLLSVSSEVSTRVNFAIGWADTGFLVVEVADTGRLLVLVAVEDEGGAEEEERKGDEEDQGQLLLQVGQPGRSQVLNLIKQEFLFFCALDDDGHGEAGHDEPLDIEHLEKKRHRIGRRMRRYRHHLDQQPGVVVLLLLHLGAAQHS